LKLSNVSRRREPYRTKPNPSRPSEGSFPTNIVIIE